MKILKIIILSFTVIPSLSYSQSTYLVGTSNQPIEPDQSLISLHLGGYGAPRDGRFTLQWVKMDPIPEITAITGLNNKLYLISKDELLSANLSGKKVTWKKYGKAPAIRAIAGYKNELYGLSNSGELLKTNVQGGTPWKKIGTADKSVSMVTVFKNNIFGLSQSGAMWAADLTAREICWKKVESISNSLPDIVSLTSNDRKLFALSSDNIIYQCEPGKSDSRWLKTAYRNGETIREDIKFIAVFNALLFGVTRENILCRGEHRSEGNLSARAMAIKGDATTVVLVNVDVCGLNDTFTGVIKQELFLKHKLPAAAIFINSSHTHFAPVTQNWLTWQEPNQRPDSVYLYSTVKNGIVNAIENALKAMIPAELSFGRGAADLGYNRSLKDHQEIYDNAVDVLKADFKDVDSQSYLFLAACHPVFSTVGTQNYTITANYPGVARKLVEERTGTTNSLFLQGTGGDINPKDNGEYITGEKLSNEVIAILGRSMTNISGPISCFLDTINLPVKPWTKEEIETYRAQNIEKIGDVYAEKNVKWCDLMTKYKKDGTMPKSMPVYVNTINIGNWKLVGFSRETTTGYGLGVKSFWPGKLVSVAGYTNDVSSYLPTHMHIEAGTYEGKDSFFWYGMPCIFPENVDEIILDRVKSLAR